jgi:uncharacterized cupin superfamily protein
MSDSCSITNLRKLEDSAPKFGLPDTFQARFAKGALGSEDVGVSLQKVGAGESAPFAHRHTEQPEELYVVIAGSGTITVDGTEHALKTWDVVRVSGPSVRSFAAGDEDLEYLAFGRIHPSDYELVQLDGSTADGG